MRKELCWRKCARRTDPTKRRLKTPRQVDLVRSSWLAGPKWRNVSLEPRYSNHLPDRKELIPFIHSTSMLLHCTLNCIYWLHQPHIHSLLHCYFITNNINSSWISNSGRWLLRPRPAETIRRPTAEKRKKKIKRRKWTKKRKFERGSPPPSEMFLKRSRRGRPWQLQDGRLMRRNQPTGSPTTTSFLCSGPPLLLHFSKHFPHCFMPFSQSSCLVARF